ncbi:MAG: hypothetical protein ABFD69_14740 [Candidatus Sumerlaeia bacterium]
MVQLELWNGARGNHERRVIKEMTNDLIELELDGPVWALANALAQLARRTGKTIPATDILIEACARRHGIEVEHADRHFIALAALSN